MMNKKRSKKERNKEVGLERDYADADADVR